MDEFQIQNINSEQYINQEYNSKDLNLLEPILLNRDFGLPQDYIEFHIIDPSGDIIESDYNYSNYRAVNNIDNSLLFTSIEIDPQEDISLYGYNNGQFDLNYNFYRNLFGSSYNNQFYIQEISLDRTELKLSSTSLNYIQLQSQYLEFIANKNLTNFYSDFVLNFGNNETIIGVNIALDNINISSPTIFIKLYEALPSNYIIKDTLWVSEVISDASSYKLTKDFIYESPNNDEFLRGPNFNIELNQQLSTNTQYLNISNILDSGSVSYNHLQSIIKDNISINIDYNNTENFIHFSSSKERLENFIYKLNQIQILQNDLDSLNSLSQIGSAESSIIKIKNQINTWFHNFDGYENFLYYESGSNSYPKSNNSKPYINYPTNTNEVLSWLGSDNIEDGNYGGKILEFSNFDNDNRDYIWNNLPEYIKFDSQNNQLKLLISMLGQHFDYIWTYIKDITNKNIADNRLDVGISKDLVAETLTSLGIKLYTNSRNKNNLLSSILGINPDGSYLPETGSYKINTYITASQYTIPDNDINKEVYKRIYHNLPTLLKTKGTKRGLRVLMNCFGIPDTILNIKEYGGSVKDLDLIENKLNKFNYSLKLNKPSYISIPFSSNQQYINSTSSSINPDTIEFRFKLDDIIPTQFILEDENSNIIIKSDFISGSQANIYFGLYSDTDNNWSYSTPVNLPLYNNDWWNLSLSREIGGLDVTQNNIIQNYTLKIGNKNNFGIQNIISSSIIIDGNISSSYNDSWNNINNILYPGGKINPYSGSIQEFRFWIGEIPTQDFKSHIENPKSISYINETGSYNNLIFRASLGSELDNNLQQENYSIHPSNIYSFISGGISSSIFEIVNFSSSKYDPNYEQFLINSPNNGSYTESNEKIKIIDTETLPDNTLSFNTSIVKNKIYQNENSSKIEISFSPQNTIDNNIIEQLGNFNIDEYIGDPRDKSKQIYSDLNKLKIFYFKKYISEQTSTDLIKLLSYFDNSLFKMIKDFIPIKSDLSSGFVIKSPILERNKIQIFEPTLEVVSIEGYIDTAFISGSNALNTTFNTNHLKLFNTPKGTFEYEYSDKKELFNGELPFSDILIYNLPKGNIIYELNKINPALSGSNKIILNPILNNIELSKKTNKFLNVDYSSNINIPVNNNYLTSSLLDGVDNKVVYADVQESNYSLVRHTNPRYNGSKTISQKYNNYTVGDQSYGKTAAIDKNSIKFAYFEEITSQSFSFPNRSNVYIKYLIDIDSNIIELTEANKTLFDVQNIFKGNADILFDNNLSPTNQKSVEGLKPIFAGGFRYEPILQNFSTNSTNQPDLDFIYDSEISIDNPNPNSQVTSSLPYSLILGNAFLTNAPYNSPINYLTNNISLSINSSITIPVTRNISYDGDILQNITGSLTLKMTVYPDKIEKIKLYTTYNSEYEIDVPIPVTSTIDTLPVGTAWDTLKYINAPIGTKISFYNYNTTIINSTLYGNNTKQIIPSYNSPENGVDFIKVDINPSRLRYSLGLLTNNMAETSTLMSSSLVENTYYNVPEEGLEYIVVFPLKGKIFVPAGMNSGNVIIRNVNNIDGIVKASLSLFIDNNDPYIQIKSSVSNTLDISVGVSYYYSSAPTKIYITGSQDNGFNSGSGGLNNWYFERGNIGTNTNIFSLLTASFNLSTIWYDQYSNPNSPFYQNSFKQLLPTQSITPLGDFDNIVEPFLPKIGDLIRFYNHDNGKFPVSPIFEREITNIYPPLQQNIGIGSNGTGSYQNRLVFEVSGGDISNQSCINTLNDIGKITNFIFLTKIPRENNIVIDSSKRNGQTSTGILIPEFLDKNTKEQTGNIIKNLKAQSLI